MLSKEERDLEFAHDFYLDLLYSSVFDMFDYCIKKQDYWERTKMGGYKQLGEFDILGYKENTAYQIELKYSSGWRKAMEQLEAGEKFFKEYQTKHIGILYLYDKDDMGDMIQTIESIVNDE